MQISVLIEPVGVNGYRATSNQPFAAVAEAPTREEALAKLKEKYQDRLRDGAEIVTLEMAPQPHPLAEFAGMFKDDPDFQDVLDIIAENRKTMDADPDVP